MAEMKEPSVPRNIHESSAMFAPPSEEMHGRRTEGDPNELVRAATAESDELMRNEVVQAKPRPMHPPYHRPLHMKHEPYVPVPPPKAPPAHLQSVISTSFSIDDGSHAPERAFHYVERRPDHHQRKFARSNSDPMDRREPPHFVVAPGVKERVETGPPIGPSYSNLSRSFSSSSDYFRPPMKRSFFHHAKSGEMDHHTPLPPDFMPPKRSKVEPPRKVDVTISPQFQQHNSPRGWYPPPQWETRDDDHSRDLPPPNDYESPRSAPPYAWYRPAGLPRPIIHRPRARVAPLNTSPQQLGPGPEYESPHRFWAQSPSSRWTGPSTSYQTRHFWSSPTHSWQHRDEADSTRGGVEMREGYEMDSPPEIKRGPPPNRDQIFRSAPPLPPPPQYGDKMKLVVEAASFTESTHDAPERSGRERPVNCRGKQLMLLALPQDKVTLSETLCVVRENIEVFTATQSDVDAPAPGRKHAVVVGQVGLRCIHCRHTTKASDRVKRAVCYPSSIKRIYRTVIDMKLDHFSQCKFVPEALTKRLKELKAIHTRSTGTTMQYFIKAAHALGMEDGTSGVRLNLDKKEPLAKSHHHNSPGKKNPPSRVNTTDSLGDSSSSSMDVSIPHRRDSAISSASFDSSGAGIDGPLDTSGNYFEGNVPLALTEDKTALSPLRCFLREQVCAFSATEEDIAVRAPTTFSISVGQVGIGCIHCVKQPPKLRSNRAVCFPFSIGRIYQSVADIQRFHLGECKMLPTDVKEKFLSLQSASSKGSKGLATRQYWVASARKLGLVDTTRGIRFGRDPSLPQQSNSLSLDILAQAAFSVTTTNKKLVLPEDKETIAEFLYLVMEQVQPCRFTEADRNKRRVRDVGCIGVECKHCAGQVDSRKFFWSSVSAVESNFVSVHTHMLECRMVPAPLKERLVELKKLRKEQTAKLMTGSQKAFFRRVWERLHSDEVQKPDSPNSADSMATDARSCGSMDEKMQTMQV